MAASDFLKLAFVNFMNILDELFMKVTLWTQGVNRRSSRSSKRFLYAQFMSWPQEERPYELFKSSNIKLLIAKIMIGLFELSRLLNISFKRELWENWYSSMKNPFPLLN